MKQKKKNKNKKWIKPRHAIVRNILYPTLGFYSRLKYGLKLEKFAEQEKRPYLILYNHQTAFDQFFVGMAFKGPLYYLASEDIFSNGFSSSLIKYLVEPIPIKKQTTDIRAILNCMKVSKEGGSIAIAPEGNRTYSGRTEYMSPAIASLARKLGVPVALFRIEGGYGVHPRWADDVRKGRMRAYVSRVISPEEYAEMSDEELFCQIKDGLYVNEAVADAEYKHKRLAEYLERAVYVCPECGLSEFESHGDIISCKRCSRQIRYLPTKELRGVGFDFPFRFVLDWYDYQASFMNSLDVLQYTDTPLYSDVGDLYTVVPNERKNLVSRDVCIELYGDRLSLKYGNEEISCPFSETDAVTVLGRNKLNIYHGGNIYQIKPGKRFCALKYVHVYNRYKNITSNKADAVFLGL